MSSDIQWVATAVGYTDLAGGIWRDRLALSKAQAGRGALFLDRDGVVVEEVDYLCKPEDVRLTEGAGTAIAQAAAAGYQIVLVTNQSGIARNYFDWVAFEAVQAEISRQLAQSGAAIDAIYACGYHEAGTSILSVPNHPWRKPSPGMLLCAVADLGIQAERSFIVGDKASDLQAGKSAGLPAGFLVGTGYGSSPSEKSSAGSLAADGFTVTFSPKLADAWASIRTLAGIG